MAVRFVHVEQGPVAPLVAARVAVLTQTRSVLVVAARLPAPVLRQDLEHAGADLSRVFILDATSHRVGAKPADPEHEAYVPGPAMLELIAKRAEQVIRAKAERPVAVVIDDVGTFAQYNPPAALVAMLRQSIAKRRKDSVQEYVWTGNEPAALARMASALVQEHYDVTPSGELSLRSPPRGGGTADVGVGASRSTPT